MNTFDYREETNMFYKEFEKYLDGAEIYPENRIELRRMFESLITRTKELCAYSHPHTDEVLF